MFIQTSTDGVTWANREAPFDVTSGVPVNITRSFAYLSTDPLFIRIAGASAITTVETAPPYAAELTLSGTRSAVVYDFTPNVTATSVMTQTSTDGVTWANRDAPFDVTAGTPVSITRNLTYITDNPLFTRVAGASAITTVETVPSA